MYSKIFTLLRQILPVVIGSLLGVSFGTMLGWPSITFPLLVDPEITPIPITWDQSAMIAGFLMEGNIIGTAFSSATFIGGKPGVILSCCCQIAGWIAMYFAQDIPGIGVSRALVGFGSGFGTGQLRIYAEETCDPRVFQKLMQYMPLSINVGVILVYAVGGFVSFRVLSLVFAIVPVINIVLFTIIPQKMSSSNNNSLDVVEANHECKTSYTDTKMDHEKQTAGEASPLVQLSFIGAFKDKKIRWSFLLLWFLIFIPQYTGGAANIVYSQVVHIAALNPYPKLCSIIYSIVFLLSNIVALTYTNKFPRRPVLLASCLICSLLLCSVCFYFYFLVDLLEVSTFFVWSPLFLLCIFNFFHTMGVNTIPILLISDKFPENARIVASKFYVMYFSLSAVISTKIFQVIFTYCGMHMAYVFLSSVGVICAFIAYWVVKEPSHNKMQSESVGFENEVDINDEFSYSSDKYNISVVPTKIEDINLHMQNSNNSTIIPRERMSVRDEIVTCRI